MLYSSDSKVFVDLVSEGLPFRVFTWGDGTSLDRSILKNNEPFANENLSPASYVMWPHVEGNILDDTTYNRNTFKCLCQGNFAGVHW